MCQAPHPRPRLPAKALRPGVRKRTRGGCACGPGTFSPNLESNAQPVIQGPGARGHLTQRGHTGLQEVDAIVPLPREHLEPKPKLEGAGPEAAATPGTRKGRGWGEIKRALAWSNLSQHQDPGLDPGPQPGAHWRAELGDPGGRVASPGAGWLLGGQEVRPAAVAAAGPSIPGSGPPGGS